MSKVLIQFSFPEMHPSVYEGTLRDLEAAGKGNIPERLYHVAAQDGKGWHVTDVWTSEEAFNNFAETMVPILTKNGGKPATPRILKVNNIIKPKAMPV